jgi:hypothetical protein
MWIKMTAIAEVHLKCTATSCGTVDSLANRQWPPTREEGVFT